ncbi:MAG: ABC transporter permease [Chloroflexi bacterium]|nr:ABC transporter permease [Chloroflexota bacterium]
MRSFLARRVLYGIIAILGALLVIFVLSRLSGDPLDLYLDEYGGALAEETRERFRQELALDQPVVFQYVIWVGRYLRGQYGDSLIHQRPVITVVKERFWTSIQLGVIAWIFGTMLGVPLGIVSAVQRGRLLDYIARGIALVGQAAPVFWVGIMAILIFSGELEWLPSGTRGDGFAVRNYILPSIVLGWLPAAAYLRLTRSSMLEVLESEYVKFARAKGVDSSFVIWKHAFRNAVIPPLTLSGLILIGFINGTTVIETVFSWPGLGRVAVQAVQGNDFPLISAITFLTVVLYVVVVLTMDVLYAILDPRIRYA